MTRARTWVLPLLLAVAVAGCAADDDATGEDGEEAVGCPDDTLTPATNESCPGANELDEDGERIRGPIE